MSSDLEARVKSLEDTLQRLTQALIAIPAPVKLPAQLANENTEKNAVHPPVGIRVLQDGMKGVNVSAKIVEKGEKHKVTTQQGPTENTVAIIADETGSIKLVLWGEQIDQVQLTDNVTIENGYVSSYKGEIQLNVGKWGKLTVGAKPT